MPRALFPFFIFLFARCFAYQALPAAPANHLADPFATGWILVDTNGDGIDDFINGKVVVPATPTASENAAAANIAARIGYGATGLTPPLVVSADPGRGPRIVIGKAPVDLEKEEGGVFPAGDSLILAGADDAGLQAAAEAYSARAPYQWRVGGEKLAAIAEVAGGELAGVTYQRGKAGIHRAFLRGAVTQPHWMPRSRRRDSLQCINWSQSAVPRQRTRNRNRRSHPLQQQPPLRQPMQPVPPPPTRPCVSILPRSSPAAAFSERRDAFRCQAR